MTWEEWMAEGRRRFGDDINAWRFICPVCKHVAAVRDWRALGEHDAAGFSCVGRWLVKSRDAFREDGPGPCNYAGGGLFALNPVEVVFPDGRRVHAFAFADTP